MEREASSSQQQSRPLQKHDSVSHEAHQAAADGKVKEPPPIPPAKGQEHEAVLVAPDDKSIKPEKDSKGVTGRRKYKGGENWDVASGKQAPAGGKKKTEEEESEAEAESKKEDKTESQEEHEVEVELNSILKKGPSKSYDPHRVHACGTGIRGLGKFQGKRLLTHTVIVFSKSYCPYSKKAKDILLEKYTIVPTPYVIELDEHRLGSQLQAALEKSTGRRTVPNILINGRSIGGGDDVQKLDLDGQLVGKVKSMGGKRIMEAKLRGGT